MILGGDTENTSSFIATSLDVYYVGSRVKTK